MRALAIVAALLMKALRQMQMMKCEDPKAQMFASPSSRARR